MDTTQIIKDMESSPYMDQGFRQVIEDHMLMIKAKSRSFDVPPILQHRYDGNFYGLLAETKSIPFYLFWVCLRVNDFHSPLDFREGMTSIKIPDDEQIGGIFQAYNTRRVK